MKTADTSTPPSSEERGIGHRKNATSYELLSLPLPFFLWFVTFIHPLLGFWPMLTISTSLILVVSVRRVRSMGLRLNPYQVLMGILSGAFLFAFFWGGAMVARSIPGFSAQVSSVYQLRGNFPVWLVSILLIFPIGPAEALYWQGLIQRRVSLSTNPIAAVFLSSFLYTAIHLPTLNPSLMFVALVGGLVWGFAYVKSGNIIPIIGSHVIFDELAFVIFTIG
jgi:membrane protease YdiL (CAAX protease family)